MNTNPTTKPVNIIHFILKLLFATTCLLLMAIFFSPVNAQNGYIYIHNKALDESSSIDFTYNVTGGTTIVPTFTLNDNPVQIPVLDLGAAENGRLWASSKTNVLYYRDANSTVWVNTGIAGVAKVDAAPNGDCYYISTLGTVFSYNGSGLPIQISSIGQFSNAGGFNDIASGWTGTPTGTTPTEPALYVVNDNAVVYKYSGSGTVWNTYTSIPGFAAYRVDVNPTNGNVYVAGNTTGAGTQRTIREITPDVIPVVNNLGTPGSNTSAFRDVAANQNGEIYAIANDQAIVPFGVYVYKFTGGTSWVKETGSFDGYRLTGGVSNSLWLSMASGGWDVNTYPFYNIFSRAFDGTDVTYIDDERVRVTTGNSQLITVAPGTYTITEATTASWDLQKILVYDPSSNSSTNQMAGTATLTVAAGEVVHVVYQNGLLNQFVMTNSCANAYLETFGSGPVGSYGSPEAGQTSYHYLAANAPGEDGHYKIVNKANPDFNIWGNAAGIIDHTPGDSIFGYMYAVNAGYDKGEFFRRRFVGVISGATYNFSAWIINLTSANVKPNVSFLVLDHVTQAVLGSYSTGDLTITSIPDSWKQYGFSFLATATDLDLVIGNNGLGGNGNDLALDDISFSMEPVPAPITTVTNTGCGTLGKITVTFPLGAEYEYSIDSFATAPHISPIFDSLTAGIYTVSVRFVGTVGCFRSKIDLVGATVCGNIWNDDNGNAINNSESPITSGVWLNAVDPITHAVIQSVQVDASGNYSVSGLNPNSSYQIILTNADQTGNTNLTTATMPTGYAATGTNLSAVVNTADTTGVITINTGVNGIVNQNFAIENLPNSDSKIQQIAYPTGGVINAGTVTTNATGNDTEDGPLTNSNTLVITNLPANATMLYNGISVGANQQITNFNPALISFTGIAIGSTSVIFSYAFVDAAGKQDPTPASFTVNWLTILPVQLQSFTAKVIACGSTELYWKISGTTMLDHFEIERNYKGGAYQTTAAVASNAGTEFYSVKETNLPAGQYQYRLKILNADGQIKYSPTVLVKLDCNQNTLLVYPNPAKDKITITGLNTGEQITLYNASMQRVQSIKANAYQQTIDITTLTTGTYFIIITNKKGEQVSKQKIAKIDR